MPKLVVFAGPPCSGKSTLAGRLSKELNAEHIQMDYVRSRILPKAEHTVTAIDVAYRAMHLAAELLLSRNCVVIVDATYGRKPQRSELESIAKQCCAKVYLIQCGVQPAKAARRFKRRDRGHPAADLTLARVALLAERYPYSELGLILGSTISPDRALVTIRRYLNLDSSIPLGIWPNISRDAPTWPGPEASTDGTSSSTHE